MNTTNRKLLDEVITEKLEAARDCEAGSDGSIREFNQAMQAIDKSIELDKLNRDIADNTLKLVSSEKEAKKNRIIRCVEIGAGIAVIPLVDYLYKMKYAREICEFEKEGFFSSSAGRAISGLFRWKK